MTFNENPTTSGAIYLVLASSTVATSSTYYSIKLADVPDGAGNPFSIVNPNSNWDGTVQNFVPITNTSYIAFLQFISDDESINFQTEYYINFTPRTAISVANMSGQNICGGTGSAHLSASPSGGVAPYTYSWSPSTGLSSTTLSNPTASPTQTTTYTVTVKDSGKPIAQSISKSVTVTVIAMPTITLNGTQGIEIGPCGTTTIPSWSVTGYPSYSSSINWTLSPETLNGSGGQTAALAYTYSYTGSLKTGLALNGIPGQAGTFSVSASYTTSSGCTSSTSTINSSVILGECAQRCYCNVCPLPNCIPPTVALSVSAYPNPVSTTLSIQITDSLSTNNSDPKPLDQPYQLSLFNNFSQSVYSIQSTERETQIPLDGIPSGIYYLHFNYKGTSLKKHIVIKK